MSALVLSLMETHTVMENCMIRRSFNSSLYVWSDRAGLGPLTFVHNSPESRI